MIVPTKMRTSTILWLGAGAVAATVAAVWAVWPSSSAGRADADDARQVALGEAIYRQNCASCHGASLEGQPEWRIRKPDGRLPAPPHDETGHTWHHPDGQLFRITKLGLKPPLAPEGYESDMPPFGPILTDEQIWAVLAFVKSRWPAEIRARQNGLNRGASR
jgi:mono/diheme cytochrome c family protein